jgi:D-alanyl-D-alanine carboxypeptidase
MSLKKKLLGIFLVALVSCSAPSFSEIASKKLSEYLSTHKDTSAVYMVSKDDKIITHGAVGLFDREANIPLKPDQIMPIASGTKQMTAAIILKLQERGMLTTEDTVGKFLSVDSGWWPNNVAPEWLYKITIHHLLTHTSGLAEYIPALKFDINQSHDRIKHLISEYAANTPLTHQPGEKYQYSNTGYFFLGLIIEKLTSQDLATVFKKELFDPLGMSNSHMASIEEAIKFQNDQLEGFPKRYFAIPTGGEPQFMQAKVDFFLVPFSDGGVVSSVEDLVKWNKSFHSGKVVSEYSYKLMTTPYNDGHDFVLQNVKTGYGVYIATLPDGQLAYYHGGRAVAIRSEHGYIPSSNLYFAIMSNIMPYETPEMAGKVDYSIPGNQFDIGFFRTAIWDLVTKKSEK